MKPFLPILLLLLAFALPAHSMSQDGCGSGSCIDCHSLDVEEAGALIGSGVGRVLGVQLAEIPGLWEIKIEKQNKKFPLYMDFSKSYLVSGSVFRLEDRENITDRRKAELNRVDVSIIPLGDALLVGKADAKKKVIVITDPECPYCKRLHEELKEVVALDPEIAFLIKLYPLKMHPNAYEISKSIVCANSMEMLEASFAGKPLPPATCETKVVDETMALARNIGVTSTPTLILPDGLVVPGFKPAEKILNLLGSDVVTEPVAKAAGSH